MTLASQESATINMVAGTAEEEKLTSVIPEMFITTEELTESVAVKLLTD